MYRSSCCGLPSNSFSMRAILRLRVICHSKAATLNDAGPLALAEACVLNGRPKMGWRLGCDSVVPPSLAAHVDRCTSHGWTQWPERQARKSVTTHQTNKSPAKIENTTVSRQSFSQQDVMRSQECNQVMHSPHNKSMAYLY